MPYRGTAPALNDLVAGQIDIIVDQTSNSISQVRAGNIRAYAVTDDKRVASAPEVPTVDEAGMPGFHMTLWSGLWVPKGRCRRRTSSRQKRSAPGRRPRSQNGGR